MAVVGSLLLTAGAAAECISTAVPVSQPVVFPNHGAGPLAWTGSRFGVAKVDAGGFSNAVDFAIYDGDFNQIGADVQLAPASLAGAHATVWNGSEFAVFYQTTLMQLVFQRVNANGNPIGGPIAVAPQHGNASGEVYEVAWDSSLHVYAVLHTITAGIDRGLWLSSVTPDGTLTTDTVISVFNPDPVSPALAVVPGGPYGIALSRLVNGGQQEIAFEVVTPSGRPLSVTSIRTGGSFPRVATDGHFFLVVYGAPVPGGTALRSVKFDLAGNIVTPDAPVAGGDGDLVPTSVIANPALGEWALLYQQFQLGFLQPGFAQTRIHRIPFSGAVQNDSPFALDKTKARLAPQSELTWNGAYVASVSRLLSQAQGTESYLVRHCPLVVVAVANPAVTFPDAKITFTANPSGGLAPYQFSWSFGDISSPESGQTVTHSYRLGTYTVTVTATDANGGSISSTVTVTIANLKRRPSKHI